MREKPKVITSVRKATQYERDERRALERSQARLLFFGYGIIAAAIAYMFSQLGGAS